MGIFRQGLILSLMLAGPAFWAQAERPSQGDAPSVLHIEAEQLFAMANRSRAAQGVGLLKWDPALTAAALDHCQRMAAEGPISHRYAGEPELSTRAGHAGAHFSLIEENIAVGPNTTLIHQGWMNSPGHRSNLLNPEVDRVGIAVVAHNGVLYAATDFARAVQVFSQAQVENTVSGLLHARGLTIVRDPSRARAYCANGTKDNSQAGFFMRWENPDLTQLPPALVSRLGQYRNAAVGSCTPQQVEGSFTTYRLAVILY
jgi:uncharacterized protein YkwD